MKEVRYIPECFEQGVFSGHLVLLKPSVHDLFEGSSIVKKAASDEIEATKELLSWSKNFYKEVDVKSIDGSHYETFDSLMSDAECLAILQEVAMTLVGGINKKKLMMTPPSQKKGK